MFRKHLEPKTNKETKPKEMLREILGIILVAASFIFKAVYETTSYDVKIGAGGKAAVVVLIILFILILYIQSNKLGKR